jgi:hypothetical protein
MHNKKLEKMKKTIIILSIVLFVTSVYSQDCVTCNGNTISNNGSAIGSGNIATGDNSVALGENNEATGGNSLASGFHCLAKGNGSISMGIYNDANNAFNVNLGSYLKTSGTGAMAIGYGISPSQLLQNTETYSLAIGMNSTIPTLFVKGGTGAGTLGKIGIGTTDPQSLLDVAGTFNVDEAATFGDNVTVNDQIEAKRLKLTNGAAANKILQSDANGLASWVDPLTLNVDDGDWAVNGNDMYNLNNANVGIGTTNPGEKLEVDGIVKSTGLVLNNGTQAAGKILRSDANGLASWVDPTSINDGDWNVNGSNMYSLNSGNIGIGIAAPESPLHIDSDIGNENATFFKVSNIGTGILGGGTTTIGKKAGNGPVIVQQAGNLDFGASGPSLSFIQKSFNGETGLNLTTFTNEGGSVDYSSIKAANSQLYILAEQDIIFSTDWDKAESVYFKANGNVGIGLNNPGEKLEVAGNIKAVEMDLSGKMEVYGKIEAGEIEVKEMKKWEDEVFEESYELATLTEVEEFIKENRHLPEIPSEAEVLDNGYNIGEMDAMLLKKIEELTLYVIELEKMIKNKNNQTN